MKGKENKVADCLSRLFPITADTLKQAIDQAGITEDEGNETDNLRNQLPETEIFTDLYNSLDAQSAKSRVPH